MKKTTKAFDCVEMKNQIQAKMHADFMSHRDKFATYTDYIKAQAEKSPWVRRMRKKMHLAARIS